MKKLSFLVLTLDLIWALVPAEMAQAKKPAPKLEGTTKYSYVFEGPIDTEGRQLVWQGPITGDIEGVIQWWIGEITKTGGVSHYDDRCVILESDADDAPVLLAVDESGSTTTRDGQDTIWRTNGVVTDGSGGFEDWIGRQTHADGNVEFDTPGGLPGGMGTFRVN